MNDPEVDAIVEKLKRLTDDMGRLQQPSFLRSLNPDTVVTDWYVAPYVGKHLRGNVVGHPELNDGPFESSELWYINKDFRLARSLSRWFRLGEPLPSARRWR